MPRLLLVSLGALVLPAVLAFAPSKTRLQCASVRVYAALDDDTTTFVSASAQDGKKKEVTFESFSDAIIPIMLDPDVRQRQDVSKKPEIIESILNSYWGSRIALAAVAAIYGTNFALGSIMNDALPASAATTARMVLASLALAPFVPRISPNLRARAVLCGCFTAMGYVTQSIALTDTDPARVSFLGAATVLWIPFLESMDGVPMGWKYAPQTWLSAVLCLVGVGILELYDPASGSIAALSMDSLQGDILSLLQAVGFGTGVFLSAKMVREEPDQVLPVTSVLIATTAFIAMLWSFADGWIGQPGWQSTALPAILLDPSLQQVAVAVVWTGLISTSFNFFVEIAALGHVPPSEASVLLASEPIWAAVFAAAFIGESMAVNEYMGGAFIIAACLINATVKPEYILNFFQRGDRDN